MVEWHLFRPLTAAACQSLPSLTSRAFQEVSLCLERRAGGSPTGRGSASAALAAAAPITGRGEGEEVAAGSSTAAALVDAAAAAAATNEKLAAAKAGGSLFESVLAVATTGSDEPSKDAPGRPAPMANAQAPSIAAWMYMEVTVSLGTRRSRCQLAPPAPQGSRAEGAADGGGPKDPGLEDTDVPLEMNVAPPLSCSSCG